LLWRVFLLTNVFLQCL